jgi:NAD(P)-dependent dehydrogenase (short-subunit alcohol dehydrogenase family)
VNGAANSLAGRRVVITSGSRGIGKAMAARLLGLGASATLLARDESTLRAAAAERSSVGTCDWRSCDVTREADVGNVMGEFTSANLRASILINNAGAASSAKFAETGLEDRESMLRTNLTSTYLCTRALLPALVCGPLGRVVDIASTDAVAWLCLPSSQPINGQAIPVSGGEVMGG